MASTLAQKTWRSHDWNQSQETQWIGTLSATKANDGRMPYKSLGKPIMRRVRKVNVYNKIPSYPRRHSTPQLLLCPTDRDGTNETNKCDHERPDSLKDAQTIIKSPSSVQDKPH